MSRRVVVTETVVTRTQSSNESGSDAVVNLKDLCKNAWVRFFTFELPVISMLISILVLLQGSLFMHDAFLHPYLQSLEWTEERALQERTYPSFDCASDPSAVTLDSPDELYLAKNISPADATDFVMQHGGAVFPDLVPKEYASELRDYLLTFEFLSGGRQLPLITNEDRFSKGLTGTEHPSLPKVLHSISSNPLLRETLEQLLGRNPAILALSTIIAQSGADHQNYHVDKPPDGSSMQFARSFVPNYALLIPLQDTTGSMGATAICPGTHRCNEMNRSYADERGFQAIPNTTGVWPSGHGLLYNPQVRHRGSAHVGEEVRVVLIVTFASRPRLGTRHHRALPLLPLFAMRRDMWGFTLNDMLDTNTYMQFPWLRSFGIWKHKEADWGWTIVEDWCAMFADRVYSRLGEKISWRLATGKFSWLTSLLFPFEEFERWKETDREGAPYEWFLVEYTRRLRWLALALLVATGAGYYSFVTEVLNIRGRSTWVRIAATIVAVSVLAVCGIDQLRTSSKFWCDSDQFRSVSSLRLPLPESNTTLIEHPTFQDILFSPASSAEDCSLFAFSRILDYHEGNRQWHAAASKYLDDLAHQPIDSVVTKVVKAATKQDKTRRFLKQVYGGWIEMNHTEALEAARGLISKKASANEMKSCKALQM